ncbi:hypothetical protein [Amycolatopsis australiensis]|uniref:Uncharacterized protein n=1 Tax=Amycolatopsis australiensis TaxID=546364 RepID=A0A1K1LL19_9PSEU|nr:hypothetical protein [Amycolatopsis australiensis]SFW11597.1 hypothetical protein SAMN04489730_0037 [Amycolatopsis australiensis]
MSHSRPPATRSDAQRARLALAEADWANLARFEATTRDPDRPLTALQWLAGAALAAAVAEHFTALAAMTTGTAGARMWAEEATRLRDTAARYELAATLAEPQDSDHVAHDAA